MTNICTKCGRVAVSKKYCWQHQALLDYYIDIDPKSGNNRFHAKVADEVKRPLRKMKNDILMNSDPDKVVRYILGEIKIEDLVQG